MAGGDLRDALDKDKRTELIWYRKGYQIALDIARGLHFLHSHAVSAQGSLSMLPWMHSHLTTT